MKTVLSRVLVVLLSAYFIICCTTNDIHRGKEIAVNLDNQTDIRWSDCSETELSQQDTLSRIGNIDKTICLKGQFIICSRGRLLLFASTGNFIRQIGRRGRAANEYIGYTDCWVEDEHIYLYDMNGKKVLKYTLDNQLEATFPLNEEIIPDTYPFAFIVPFGSGYLGRCVWNGTTGESPALALYNDDFSFKRIVGDLTIASGLRLGYPLVCATDYALYWNPLGRTIYQITPNADVIPAYTISFGDKNYPELTSVKDDYELLDLYQDKAWRKNHAGLITYVWETERELLFIYSYGEYMNLGVYNKETVETNNFRLLDSAHSNILSCSFDGEKLFFLVETLDTVNVYSISIQR